MTTALDIIQSAFERCNAVAPGEVLDADSAAFAFRRLNEIVDQWAPRFGLSYLSRITSAAQTGNITLGAGAWASITPGTEIVAASANGIPLAPITQQQYTGLFNPAQTGTPQVWSADGLSTVYLWPVPNGQTIKLMTRDGVGSFVDQTTDYTLPDGYKSAFSAALAVEIAPVVLGRIPADLTAMRESAVGNIDRYEPDVINVDSFHRSCVPYPPRLF